MTENKFNPDAAKRLYEEATSIGTSKVSENDFYNSLNDSEYARIVYNRYKDKYGVNLLGAEDDSSFLSTLGYNVPYAGNKTKEQEPKFSLKRPEEPKKENKVETPESFNTRIPNIQTVKDDVTGKDVSVDMDIPKTPDMTVKMPNSLDRFKKSPFGESNLSKRIFGVDSILEQESPQEKAWKEVYNSAPEAMANLGKDEVEEIYDANGEIIGEKVIRTANEADLDRIQQIQQGIKDQYDAIDKAEGEFIKQYEEYLNNSKVNEVNSHRDEWNLVNPWERRKSNQEMEFLKQNSARYNKIMSAKKALNLQSKFAQTYADLAEYDRSVEKGEQMSAMVSSGEITEDAMKILRATKSPEASRQYIERQVKNGTMSRDTANKLLKMGDLSEKNAFGYGFTHPGYAEDFLTFGMSEIKRNFDIKSINDRLKSGAEVSDDEKNALLMYSKMSDMMNEAKMDKRGWVFEAGQGLPKTLQFIAEIGITGGASAVGKGFTRKMILESIKKYGFWKAGAKMAKETGGRLVKNAWQQAIFSPITPSSYVDYSNRVLNMSLEQENISWQDRVNALYKSYAQTWAGRFSETLDNVLLDMPVGSWLYGSKYMKPVLQPAAWIAKKMEGMPWSKQTSNLLERFGIDGMHKEILTEMADPVLQAVVTGDTEELKKMWDDKEDFAKTVALHSAILGGFHGAMGYGVGAATAAIESQRVSKAYDDAMNKINKLTFVDKQLNDLKDELVASISTNNYVAQEGKNNGRTVGEILSDMDKRMQYYATTDKGTAAYESDKRVFDIADYASRVGAFKYGASQNIKDQIARRMGVAKDENGNAIPMEFEHTDGNVYEFTDVDGKQYFILDNSDSAVILMDRATGEKVIKNKSVYDAGTITQTNGNDWAMNNYLLNVENWKAQDAQSQNQQAQQPGTTVPPTQAMLRGVPVPITNFDAQTGEVTVTDQTGEELTLPVNTPNLELVYPTQQTEQAPVQPEETLQPTEEENVTAEEPVAPTEEAVEAEMQESAYVAPRGEDNDIVWNEVPAERFKQVIDEEVGSDYADGYIDMRIEDAQRKLNEHNEKQKPIASGEYKAFMEESKKLESNLAYWTIAKQEYANAVAQEVAAQNEVETPAQEEANEVAPESTVMYDAKQPEQDEAEAPVQVSKEELDANVAGWKSNGINVNVVNSIDEVTNEQVLADMKKGVKVTGWYDTKTGEVYVFAPNITDTAELDNTVIHEVVAHKGLRGLIGEKYYEQFCEKVFDSMPKELQDKYMEYPGVNGRKAAAADEYIAYLAEKEDLTAEEQTFWDRIIQLFRELFDARLVGILKKDNITDEDIAKLIRMSYANIKNNAQQEADTTVESQSTNEEVGDNGVVFENDTNGQAMYSIKTYREGGRDNLVNFAQKQVESNKLTQEQAEEIVSEMDSIYDMIQQYKDVYQPFGAWSEAEVKVDDNGKAVFSVVKPNGEYDMNLDFSLVCKKRRTLDSVFDEMIKRGVISKFELGQVDVAKINEIIREFGFETACRLCFVDAKRFRVAQVADQFCAKYNELVVMNDKQLKQVIKTEEKNSVRKKIAKHLLEHPEDKVILSRDNFMSANGFENIKVNKAAVMSLYNQAKGTGGPKASFGDVQYLNEIADSSWTPEKAYAVGGVRLQSFSDYVPRMVFDYIQMVADLAAKKLPVHSYTKESTFAKQFGLTGIKINMSLVPRVDADGVAPGLDKDGNYAWQEGETFPFDEAIAIQNAEGYKDNCGTIAVGISDEHILKMLDDENIRMIIPYHKSALNKEVAKFNNIDQFVDYTNSQNTRYADGKKLNKADSKKHFNFNEDLHKSNDPRGAAQRYLEWCDEKGYIPKFEQFRNHPNYYKLLEDFTTVVTENGVDTVVPQKAVEMKFPKETDAFGSLETLIQQGLEEDAVLEGRRSEKIGEIVDKIEETLPKNNPTDPNDGPRYRTAEQKESLFEKAKEVFGTTNNFKVAGYMLPDGSLLDFSGRWEGGPGDSRYTDHRAIGSGLYEASETDSNYDTNMYDFINQGAIRLMPESGGIYVSQPLTDAQEEMLARYIARYNGEVILDITDKDGNIISYIEYNRRTSANRVLDDISNYFDKGVIPTQPDIRYRIPSTPAEARQRAENIMKDAIAPMARELGVEVNYVTNEDISDVEPGARKKRKSKGWYQDGKVYINLSTHETIDDAKETYLHEVVAHYGLRGLLKEQFEPVMQKVFASLTPTQQQSLLEIFADEVEAAEEFLASMAENDIDPTLVEKVIGFIREALRSMGINLDNYTDGDLQYLLWRSKNSLKENAGNIETARWEAKDEEVRYRTFKNGRLSADTKYGIIDKKIEQFKDSVWSVKLLQDEIVARGGVIDDMSDPYGQSTLMSQRSSYEIGLFNSTIYKPMLKAFSKAAKAISKAQKISIFDANEKLENYLYAKHAIERNKKLAVDKMVRKASEQFADLTKEQRAQLEQIATALYEDAYTGGSNNVTVIQNGTDFELSINWFPTKSEFTDVEFDTIKTAIDEWVADNKEVNESGLTDKEAQAIIDDVYVYQNADTQDMIDQLSDNVRNCTNFILDTWLKFGIISKSDYDKYKSQYEYYVPLRGWDETSDVDYEEVAGNAYNKAEKIVSLNNRAKGRKSKADSPLAFISQIATSAVIYGNKNLMKTMAFNMIKNNYDLIQDLVFIEDKDTLTHKTKSEIKAHEVQLKVNGRTTRFSFKDNFEVGVAAASAIKGDNIQNFNKNNLLDQLLLNVGKVTRFQSRARTSWNPVFMIVNGVRDYFFGNLSFFIKHGLGDTIALNKNYAIGFAAAFMDAAGIPLGNSQWRQDYEAYKREGGQTGYVHMDDIERLKRETSKILRRYQNGWGFIPQDTMKLISYTLRVMGEPAENAMRFATFKTLKDRGVSDRRAAQAAKEITVNFNRTGTQKWPGMLYGFFNATLEGTTNYFKMGFDKKTAARFWMANATLAALSYATAWWAKGFGDDDDDELTAGMTPEELAEYKQMKEFANEYNRISDYVKHTNILIPVTGDNGEEKKFIAIPLPQSYRIASALGTTLFDIINNDKNIGDELREFAWFTIGEIQPFDIENISFEGEGLIGNVRRAISPTPILPWTEVEQNRNFMGNPIMKESFINEDYEPRKEPSYTKAGSQTPEFLIATAKEINEKLGGTEYEAAKYNEKIAQNRLDAHGLGYTLAKVADALDPASVDHILKGYFGGFYELGAGAVERYTKDQTSAEDWVLAKRFLKNATQKPGMEKYFERKEFADEVSRLLKNEKKNAKRGENKQYLNSDPYNRELVKVNEYWKKKIKKDTDAIAKLKKKGVVNKEKISELEDRRDKKILQAALAFERLERKYNK